MGWEDQEMKFSNIGDARLEKRLVKIAGRLSESSDTSFTQTFKSRAELVAACRFFDNPRASPEKILASHIQNTKLRIKDNRVVLLPNDSSSIDYTCKKSVEGLGILETSYTFGLHIHPTLVFTPDNVCLGCVDGKMWTRDGNAKRKSLPSQVRNNEPIEEKESFKWLQSYRIANTLAEEFPETQFVSMGDRESDILESIVEAVQDENKFKMGEKSTCAYVILRINHDRELMSEKKSEKNQKSRKLINSEVIQPEVESEEVKEEKKLKAKLLNAPILGKITFTMRSRQNLPERKVTQELRVCKVQLKSKKVAERIYPSVWVNTICAVEKDPPEGVVPVCWMFFTTLPIDTFEQACLIIKYYLSRWGIETFFNILKNGCKVEEKELKNVSKLKNMIALFMIVSWRIQFLMTLSRTHPDIPCTELFEASEWKSVYKVRNKHLPFPTSPPSLGEFMSMIAHLGGYLEKRSTLPGPKVIWRGLQKMYDYAIAWDSFMEEHMDLNTIKK